MKTIRIGTRSSELAVWQANTVAQQLNHTGHETEIVKIDSLGDEVLDKPLYELGVSGIFTKKLDVALLNGSIDIAVHSLKDVPTKMPDGIVQAAVLKRGNFKDVLVLKNDESFFSNKSALIATGSLRRKSQWLHRYPYHKITGLRGNVATRLQKLKDNDWDGAIFAAAGLRRLKLFPGKEKHLVLDWMIPAPAQGAVMIATLVENHEILEACKELNDEDTAACVGVEREFLRVLEGGCTAPIGALAVIRGDDLKFKGVLFSRDGKDKLEFDKKVDKNEIGDLGTFAANHILARGGKNLMRQDILIEKEYQVFSTKTLSQDQTNGLANNIGVSMSDFITIRNYRIKPKVVKSHIKNVIFTSKNAVESLLNSFSKEDLNFTNIYCVGRRTKRLIERKIGTVAHVESSAEKLANYLIENLNDQNVSFFCGNKRRDELINLLSEKEINVDEVECYKTILTPNKIGDTYSGILFFSPTGIESYLRENETNNCVAFCIGETTATKARKHFNHTVVAKTATAESVLNSVNEYFSNK